MYLHTTDSSGHPISINMDTITMFGPHLEEDNKTVKPEETTFITDEVAIDIKMPYEDVVRWVKEQEEIQLTLKR